MEKRCFFWQRGGGHLATSRNECFFQPLDGRPPVCRKKHRLSVDTTYIIPKKVVIESAARFQPETLLGILVVLEESVLVRVAQSFNLGQPIPNLRASVEHSRLK